MILHIRLYYITLSHITLCDSRWWASMTIEDRVTNDVPYPCVQYMYGKCVNSVSI